MQASCFLLLLNTKSVLCPSADQSPDSVNKSTCSSTCQIAEFVRKTLLTCDDSTTFEMIKHKSGFTLFTSEFCPSVAAE